MGQAFAPPLVPGEYIELEFPRHCTLVQTEGKVLVYWRGLKPPKKQMTLVDLSQFHALYSPHVSLDGP